jgi:organic hydroperoxide reductase OsmC/OhrA
MVQYPLHFHVESSASSGTAQTWSSSGSGLAAVPCAIPPEFQGPGGGYSPEDFFAMALANCFVATFKVFAEKSQMSFEKLSVKCNLEVDRDEKGSPWMARARLTVVLKKPQSEDKAKRILERVSQSCLVLNSVKTEKTFDFQIES